MLSSRTSIFLPNIKLIDDVRALVLCEIFMRLDSPGDMLQSIAFTQYHRLSRFKEIAFNSEIGVWNIGGYYGFYGFRGLICCVRVYRRRFLQPEEVVFETISAKLALNLVNALLLLKMACSTFSVSCECITAICQAVITGVLNNSH